MKENKETLKIDGVKFVKFGTKVCPPRKYLTINLYDAWNNIGKISEWLATNNVDKDIACLSRRQLYRNDNTLEYRLDLDRHTQIVNPMGNKLPKKILVKGDEIDIVAKLYPGTHWHGLGVKCLVETIIVHDNNAK